MMMLRVVVSNLHYLYDLYQHGVSQEILPYLNCLLYKPEIMKKTILLEYIRSDHESKMSQTFYSY